MKDDKFLSLVVLRDQFQTNVQIQNLLRRIGRIIFPSVQSEEYCMRQELLIDQMPLVLFPPVSIGLIDYSLHKPMEAVK